MQKLLECDRSEAIQAIVAPCLVAIENRSNIEEEEGYQKHLRNILPAQTFVLLMLQAGKDIFSLA